MPLLYFLILPIFLFVFVGMACVTVASRFIEPLKPAYPFIWRTLLWSSLGFLLANAMAAVPFLLLGAPGPAGTEQAADLVKLAYVAVLFLGPVITSFVGFVGGSALGIWFAFRARKLKVSRTVQSNA